MGKNKSTAYFTKVIS